MAALSPTQIYNLLRSQGFDHTGAVTGTAIVLAESGGDPTAVHTNNDGSVDRGLWQINSVHDAQISPASAFDPTAATQFAYKLSKAGADWTPWATYNSGAWKGQLQKLVQAGLVTNFSPGIGDVIGAVGSVPGAIVGAAAGPVESAVLSALGVVLAPVGQFFINAGLVIGGLILVLGGLVLTAKIAKDQAPGSVKEGIKFARQAKFLAAL